MNKIGFFTLLALAITFSNPGYSAPSSLSITYSPVVVPHGADINFNLEKGSPNGMKQATNYNLICRTSANDKTAISLVQAPAGGFARWDHVTLDGTPVGNQFMLPINSTFEMNMVRFNLMGVFAISNLDNENDITLNCTATPVF